MSRKIKEERIMITGAVSIGATVTYTDKSRVSPAVVLIMGTGKTDRDGNQKGFCTDFYKQLAELFADKGFVCFRYDKRGTYETGGDYNTAGLYDLTGDAIAVVRYAKSLPFVDGERIIVCGHSEGAMIATLLSGREKTAGLILFGGAAMSLKDALLYQNRLLAEEAKKKTGLPGVILRRQASEEKTNAKVEALFRKCAATDKARIFFGGAMMNAKWLREHGTYTSKDFVDLLKEFAKPVLAVTGTADQQVDYRNLSLLWNMKHIQTYAPQDVNHILRQIDDDNSMLTVRKQYKRLTKQPIHLETVRMMENWLRQFKEDSMLFGHRGE